MVFRKTIERERVPVPWWRLVRELRTLEARGEVRGGRFVAGFDGEQYALADAVTLLRAVRKRGHASASVPVSMPPSAGRDGQATAVVDGKVVRFKLSPALARAHRENHGKVMSEREAVAFVESRRRARALRRAKPYLETRS